MGETSLIGRATHSMKTLFKELSLLPELYRVASLFIRAEIEGRRGDESFRRQEFNAGAAHYDRAYELYGHAAGREHNTFPELV
jgi:hypothetical protein